MDQDWDGWPEDGLDGDAETADLVPGGDPDGPGGLDPDAAGDPGGDPGESGDPGDPPGADGGGGDPGPGAGYPEDDPMGAYAGLDDPGPGDDPGDDPGDPDPGAGDDDDPPGNVYPGAGDADAAETTVGADPDAAASGDEAGWQPAPFPEQLDLVAPEPVDGFPWSDPALLGAGGDVDQPPAAPNEAPLPADLLDYAGIDSDAGEDPWAALLRADDPGASSLSRYWSQGS